MPLEPSWNGILYDSLCVFLGARSHVNVSKFMCVCFLFLYVPLPIIHLLTTAPLCAVYNNNPNNCYLSQYK